ncbi:MAG TPA: beta-ketoacyl-[acyl-carrier-protein] synthase family protein [Pseudonocardiaceae bacterium]|nr:beta-ketoacyl-[acyl-carrier-protein] synthase family protein [Pseudonocardiaceae bacterium]
MRNVVITGMGIVSSLGFEVGEFSARVRSGEIGIHPAPWPSAAGAVWWSGVRDFEPARWMSPVVEAGTDLYAQFTLAAAEQSVRQSGIGFDPARTAIVHGTTLGGVRALLRAQYELEHHGAAAIDRKTMIKISPNMAAAQLAMRWNLHGPLLTVSTACASSLDAIGTAARMIADGRADAALAGGTEGGWAGADGRAEDKFEPAVFHSELGYGMTRPGLDRSVASIPFDRRRSGVVTGEGSAMFVLEREESARARGAAVLAEVVGYASLADACHPSSPEPTGRWEAEVMRQALAEAELSPNQVDALIAHATSTPKGDTAEISAINTVHARNRRAELPVMSLKGHIGHSGAAAGAMSLVTAVHTLGDGVLPHTAGTREVDPEAEFTVVTGTPVDVAARTIQLNAFGFGGQNASLIVRRRP